MRRNESSPQRLDYRPDVGQDKEPVISSTLMGRHLGFVGAGRILAGGWVAELPVPGAGGGGSTTLLVGRGLLLGWVGSGSREDEGVAGTGVLRLSFGVGLKVGRGVAFAPVGEGRLRAGGRVAELLMSGVGIGLTTTSLVGRAPLSV